MKKLLLILCLCLILIPSAANAYQLLAITTDWCPICKTFKEELLPNYNNEDVQLIEVDITRGNSLPPWYRDAYRDGIIKRLYGVPTFILWDDEDKRELVRWAGYIGEENFYAMLDNALRLAPINRKRCRIHNVCSPWFVSKDLDQPLISP